MPKEFQKLGPNLGSGGANPSVGVPSVFVLVSLSLVVGLSTAASP